MILYFEPKPASAIPEVDLSATFGADQRARQKAADDIVTACRNAGFAG